MRSTLGNLNRFLSSQALYPLVLSTVLALGFFVGRALWGRSWGYTGLVWNLFLAWIPYAASVLSAISHRLFPRQAWLLLLPGFLWLIFFPNAPYLVTDFQHLENRPPIPIWYDIGLLATFAWTGCFLAIASLRTMQYLVTYYLGKITGWIFAAGVLLLSGVGIYLGRIGRWNSWDLLLNPEGVLKDLFVRLINPLNNLRFFAFTIMFTGFLVVAYLMFVSVAHFDEPEKPAK